MGGGGSHEVPYNYPYFDAYAAADDDLAETPHSWPPAAVSSPGPRQ